MMVREGGAQVMYHLASRTLLALLRHRSSSPSSLVKLGACSEVVAESTTFISILQIEGRELQQRGKLYPSRKKYDYKDTFNSRTTKIANFNHIQRALGVTSLMYRKPSSIDNGYQAHFLNLKPIPSNSNLISVGILLRQTPCSAQMLLCSS